MSAKPLPGACLRFVAAPMVKQSDLLFRILARRHGATLAYTQMFMAHRLVHDLPYRERHMPDLIRGWSAPLGRPVVVQLGGNDPGTMCAAARVVEPYCDAVDVNLGCPQQHACDGHYGGYLIQARRDWPTVEAIVSQLCETLNVPVHVKIRLCSTASMTVELAVRLARAGASVIALHARHVSARRRRHGPADLEWVTTIREALAREGCAGTNVISNGNVRTLADCHANLQLTGAAGVMVGESLLGNPRLFSGTEARPWEVALEYLQVCEPYADIVHIDVIKQHVRLFFSWDLRCVRTAEFAPFLDELVNARDLPTLVDLVLNGLSVRKWRDSGWDIDAAGRESASAFAHTAGVAEGGTAPSS